MAGGAGTNIRWNSNHPDRTAPEKPESINCYVCGTWPAPVRVKIAEKKRPVRWCGTCERPEHA